jgi:hypothetical protein
LNINQAPNIMMMTLGLLAALQLQASAAPGDSSVGTFAGHLVTLGSRDIPFRGKVQTRTDTYVISRVRRQGDRLVLTERACTVAFRKIAGVKVWMDATALPASTFTLHEATDGWVGTSHVQWGRQDVDDDGHPGMTVHVDGICSGELHVANDSVTMATARVQGEGGSVDRITGTTRVHVRQRVLSTEGKCLQLMADDTAEVVQGPFAYTRVADDSTCESLTRSGWPVL